MSIPVRYRVQEWLADRYTWAQYPAQRHSASPRSGARFKFKYQMSWLDRFSLLVMSLIGLLIGVALLALICIGIYIII
jgi:hypothetical protein